MCGAVSGALMVYDKILYPDTGEDKEYVLNAKSRLE